MRKTSSGHGRSRRWLLGGVALALLSAAGSTSAATFVVTSTADTSDGQCDAQCTLREALLAANAAPGPDTVAFAIPGAGPHVITPSAGLPQITSPVIIDGYTQAGATPNTAQIGTNAQLKIVLDGAQIQSPIDVLFLAPGSGGSVVRGLVIQRAADVAVTVANDAGEPAFGIEGCFIGTDATGTVAQSNPFGIIVRFESTGARIGGPTLAARNLIAGNSSTAIVIEASGTTVQGNLIGVAADGSSPLGNGGPGVLLKGGTGSVIGGTSNLARNVIAFNADGVRVSNDARVSILGNSIRANDDRGIDFSVVGSGPVATINDLLDGDDGPNGLQNTPVLATAALTPAVGFDDLRVTGFLDSMPNTSFRIEIFGSRTANPSGVAEGQTLLSTVDVTTDAHGVATIRRAAKVLSTAVAIGDLVTATATRLEAGTPVETSEFSLPVTVLRGLVVTSTADGGAGSLRQALLSANADSDTDAIVFDIAGAGPHTIALQSVLPSASEPVEIDGYSEAGSSVNSRFDAASTTVLAVEIDCSAASSGTCLTGELRHVRGLAWRGSAANTSPLVGAVALTRIEGNLFGTSSTGQASGAPSGVGVTIATTGATVGGAHRALRNRFADLAGSAITFSGGSGTVIGNVIGLAADGTTILPVSAQDNLGAVLLAGGVGSGTVIGGPLEGEGNVIAGSSAAGVRLAISGIDRVTIRGNRIFGNANDGIELFGVSGNDVDDLDTGANQRQNFPELGLVSGDGIVTRVSGALDANLPGGTPAPFHIDVYASTDCDPSGRGEGAYYLGGAPALIGVDEQFAVVVRTSPFVAVPPEATVITATATDLLGNTSEFSSCVPLVSDPVAFADSFESE